MAAPIKRVQHHRAVESSNPGLEVPHVGGKRAAQAQDLRITRSERDRLPGIRLRLLEALANRCPRGRICGVAGESVRPPAKASAKFGSSRIASVYAAIAMGMSFERPGDRGGDLGLELQHVAEIAVVGF